ncbi:MAG: glycosyltransferase family 2 protein [Leptolyngbyaceae cyanobacterium bins.59]|nr:glycosyltransferase family 2 protein [Leptolyngbyaceae cyanobacterium bins.59]
MGQELPKISLPKISIVTPSLNQAPFLEATIQSVLQQGYPNLEYIIIDGASTDRSLEIIKKYESQLHFWCSEPDGGHYAAVNKGFSHATGEILGWLNSDDMHYPWTLKTLGSVLSDLPQIEWITTLYPGSWDFAGFARRFRAFPGYSREAFLDGRYLPWNRKAFGWVQQESTFWRRSLWEKVGAYIRPEFSLAGDFDLWSRFWCYSELYGLDSPLAGFRRQHTSRNAQNYRKYVFEAEQSLELMRNVLQWSPNRYRDLVLQWQLYKMPGMRSFKRSHWIYHSQKIVRRNFDRPEGYWAIEEFPFFFH